MGERKIPVLGYGWVLLFSLRRAKPIFPPFFSGEGMLEFTNHHGGGRMTTVFSWQQFYLDALLELNLAELRTKVRRAVSELEKRRRELALVQGPESAAERQAIADALHGLGAIERFELTAPFESASPNHPGSVRKEVL